MTLWLFAALLSTIVVALLAWPLLRPAARGREQASDLAIYRDQLAEIDRDIARGVLPDAEAASARLEIQRRLLAAADRPGEAADTPARRNRWAARAPAILLVLLPAAAVALYLDLGRPGLPGQPFASRGPVEAPARDSRLAQLADRLAAKMKADPSDPRGWILLAGADADLGRFRESAAAYGQAIARLGAKGKTPSAELQSRYGETLTAAADGQVTPAARTAFAAALSLDPKEASARFYLALADAQAGHVDQALKQWMALEAESPADAPWRSMLAAEIEAAAKKLGRDPATLRGRQPPPSATAEGPAAQGSAAKQDPARQDPATKGPSAEDMANAAAMTPEQRAAFIDSMVAGLAARLHEQPNDIDGWLRLAGAYGKLGRVEPARDAWHEAATRAPDRLDAQLAYAAAAAPLADKDTPPADFAATVQRIRRLAPENGLGLYCAGLLARAEGDKAEARKLWQKLLPQLPPGTPQRRELESKIAALGQ